MLVKKPNGGVRFGVDHRNLNDITKKDWYPLPLLDETIGQMRGAKYITKLDVKRAFHRIRVADKPTEDFLTIRTRYGAYKYLVMPFGVANGPSTWQNLINECLLSCLGEYATAYLDDILIRSLNTVVTSGRSSRVL